MIISIDVQYSSEKAYVAGGIFNDWSDTDFFKVVQTELDELNPYEPGSFYKRELPCLLKLLDLVEEDIEAIIIDGYCYLSNEQKKGLGAHLFESLGGSIPIIGVAKNPFKANDFCELLLRGESKKPLYITSIGVELDEATKLISQMAGENRIPTLIKRVDTIVREFSRI